MSLYTFLVEIVMIFKSDIIRIIIKTFIQLCLKEPEFEPKALFYKTNPESEPK